MSKAWDHGVPGIPFWEAALRVAKPGCHLLAFGGTRTFHRLAVAIEDAGWEIRDTVGWVYGSGFPKSHNVGKQLDKMAGAERDIIGPGKWHSPGRTKAWGDGNKYGKQQTDGTDGKLLTAPSTEAAKTWDGWGTALKPAWEPVIVARKPFSSTVAANVLEHGTGAINIDGCRIDISDGDKKMYKQKYYDKYGVPYKTKASKTFGQVKNGEFQPNTKGRWPANLIHDGSDEVLAVFPNGTSRFFYTAKASKKERNMGCEGLGIQEAPKQGGAPINRKTNIQMQNHHPTVKPIALMRYLCRLVTPPGGTVFDPFMGSGSTGVAAIQEGFEFIGCDIEEEYVEIAKRRIDAALEEGIQLSLEV